MAFQMKSSEELDAMTFDELVVENQEAGREIDVLRDYRRDVKARYSAKLNADSLRGTLGSHLTDDQAAQINAIVNAPRLAVKSKVNNNG